MFDGNMKGCKPMADTPGTRTTLTDLLHEYYSDQVYKQIPTRNLFMKQLETTIPTLAHGGKQFNIHLRYNYAGGTGTLAEGDSLPQATATNIDLSQVGFAYHYFKISLSGQAIITTQGGSKFAVVEALSEEIDTKAQAFAQSLNRQSCGDGLARLCQADGDDDGGGNVTVDNASGWTGYSNSDINGARHLSVNQTIQFRDSSGTAHDAGLLISGITPGAGPSTSAILALTGTSTSVADGDYAYIAASTTAENDNYGHEMPGIKSLIDDSTINTTTQGVNSDTYPEWRSQVGYGSTPGTAEALTSLRMNALATDIEVIAQGKTGFMATSPDVWNTYANLEDQNNTIMNAAVFDNAWPTLNFNGINVFRDPYLADEIYYVDPSTIAFYQPGSPGWIDFGGGSRNQTLDKDQMFATYMHYLTLGISNRAKNGKLVDITTVTATLL